MTRIVIRPTNTLFNELRNHLAYIPLVRAWAWRELAAPYAGFAGGLLLRLLQPLLFSAILYVFFGQVARVPTSGLPPFLFFYSGFIWWNFFREGALAVCNSFFANGGLFKKAYIPRLVPAISVLLVSWIQLVFHLTLLSVITAVQFPGIGLRLFGPGLVASVFLSVAVGGFTLGVGLCIATLFRKQYPAKRQLIGPAMQFWMFVSPVFYPATLISTKWIPVLALNPLFSSLEYFRLCWFGQRYLSPMSAAAGLLGLAVAIAVTAGGICWFFQREGELLDEL